MTRRRWTWSMLILVSLALLPAGGCRRERSGPSGPAARTGADELLVYIGSSMRLPMERCIEAYEKQAGVKVMPNYRDSGEVLAQVELSRRGDAAVLHEPFLTQMKNTGVASEVLAIASMTPVIAVARDKAHLVKGLRDLLHPDLRVGLTDARYATSGQLVQEALKKAGIQELFMARKPVEDRSSGYLATQLRTKALDAVVIWNAVAAQTADVAVTVPIEPDLIPDRFTDPAGMTYLNGQVPVAVALLKCSANPDAARKFIDFIRSPAGQDIFTQAGYQPAP